MPEGWRIKDQQRLAGFGVFDVGLIGNAKQRADILTFSVTGIDGDEPSDYALWSSGRAREGRSFFAAFVGGLGPEYWDRDMRRASGAAFFGGSAVVPLPPGGWLMLTAGTLAIRFARRRRPDGAGARS